MWRFAVVLVSAACSDHTGAGQAISIDGFCDVLNEAGCDIGQRCMTAPPDRAACLAFLEDKWDACPMVQQAVNLGEASYDPDAARVLVEQTREAPCIGNPVPDWVDEVAVFTPKLKAGQRCHSKVSCVDGLVCEDLTVSTPEGVCAPQ